MKEAEEDEEELDAIIVERVWYQVKAQKGLNESVTLTIWSVVCIKYIWEYENEIGLRKIKIIKIQKCQVINYKR